MAEELGTLSFASWLRQGLAAGIVRPDGSGPPLPETIDDLVVKLDNGLLADVRLPLVGPGDIAGMKQSGFLKLKAADLGRDLAILVGCRDYLTELLTRDPGFLEPAQAGLRKLWTKCPPFSDELVAL